MTVQTDRISTLKRGRGGFTYRQKRRFLKLRKDADRKRLFCSDVSTLLSLIEDQDSKCLKEFAKSGTLSKGTTDGEI